MKSKRPWTALVLASAITLLASSCSTEYIRAEPDVVCPVRPEVPVIEPGALDALSDEAYEALVERDALKTAHIARLEAICRELTQ